MTTSPAQPTTAALPLIDLGTFRQLVDRLQAQHPASADRIERGAAIVFAHGRILETDTLGVYRVESCQTAGTFYTVTTASCACPDAVRAPQGYCKHVAAVELLTAASVIASRQQRERLACARPIAYQLTPHAEVVLATLRARSA